MKRVNVAFAAVAAACVLFVAACDGGGGGKADEEAIRAINAKWQEAIVAKDAKQISEFYAEDGEMLPPNAPKAVGRAAIEAGWAGFMAAPGMTLTFETEKFVFAKSGDVAVDIGKYQSSIGGQADTGKSVVTWVKRDGKWYVLTDMFSSDMAPAAPAPAAGTVPEGTPLPEGTPPEAATGPAPEGTTPAPAPEATPATPAPAPATPN